MFHPETVTVSAYDPLDLRSAAEPMEYFRADLLQKLQADNDRLTAENQDLQQFHDWASPQITKPINAHIIDQINAVTAERDELKRLYESAQIFAAISMGDCGAYAGRIKELETENERLYGELANVKEALLSAEVVAIRAHTAWDSDNDPRVGKLLLALARGIPGYIEEADLFRAVVTRIRESG